MKNNTQKPGSRSWQCASRVCKTLPSLTTGQKGFTLVETLVAIFILVLATGALLTLAAGGFYSVRYSRNQIVANALMQESLEYIRNSRDSAMLAGTTWDTWRTTMSSAGCFSPSACYADPYTTGTKVAVCPSANNCPAITYFPDKYFYGYEANSYPFATPAQRYQTSFVRSVSMANGTTGSDQVVVTVTVRWINGTNTKTVSQSTLLTQWTL